MQTYSGIAVWPLDPQIEDIQIEDIAHQLSMICRFYGAVERFYSVAEHQWIMSYLVDESEAYEALMHDASEYILSDVAKPLKQFAAFRVPGWHRAILGVIAVLVLALGAQIAADAFPSAAAALMGSAVLIAGFSALFAGAARYIPYEQAEKKLMHVIASKFSFNPVMSKALKQVDARMAETERRQLLSSPQLPWICCAEPIEGLVLPCWDPDTAEKKFLERYHELRAARME